MDCTDKVAMNSSRPLTRPRKMTECSELRTKTGLLKSETWKECLIERSMKVWED